MSRPTANLTVQMSRASDGKFRMRIQDEDSSVYIAEVELDAEQFSNLMATSQAHCPATVATTEQYARVGKTLSATSERVPAEMSEGIYDRETLRAKLADYIEERRSAVGADTVRLDWHNYGPALHFSTWR